MWLVAFFLSIATLTIMSPAARAETPDKADESTAKKEDKKIKDYDEVITDKARSQSGLFRVHRVEEKLYYEIPQSLLGSDLLWVTQIAETTAGNSYAGMPVGNVIVRWEKRDDRVLLRRIHYDIRAATDDPIAEAVRESNLAPIIKIFEVQAYGRDVAPVIDVTELFTKNVPEFSAESALGAGGMDSGRTLIDRVKVFPININISVLASYATKDKESSPRSSGISAVISHSMVKLPESPMKPRLWDERVGFFSVGYTEYGDNPNHEAEDIRYITRWRLEKKDPEAEVSDPTKPIVFFVAREVPEKWKPYVKQGIEDWQPAFEKAGFSNAIIGAYPPDPVDDPDWDPEDARISSIRWLPSDIANAFGPHVHDPRTGEILEADVRMYHNVQKLVRDWYFVQASPNDERAQKLPMPDDLMGELIRFVVAHEVGHSIGFPHNMKASSSYTIAQLRDPEWTKANGTAPSIMDYARFNYVAQPGDGAGLMAKLGPYDFYAVNWGYRQFDAEAVEKEELEKLAKLQIDEPMFRFGNRDPDRDSTQQTEDLGDEAVEATRLGLKNLERVAGYLVEATSNPGDDYDLLDNMYGALWAQWSREMGHVVNVVGGIKRVNLFYGDADQRFFPNSPDYQQSAVRFLGENAFKTPQAFVDDSIVLRLTPDGVASRVLSAQQNLLRSLVNEPRIRRMAEHAGNLDEDTYRPAQLLSDLQGALFNELEQQVIEIDVYRRNLQRSFVSHLATFLESPSVDSDLPALARLTLTELGATVGILDAPAQSPEVRAHLLDIEARIQDALDTTD